MRCPPHSRRPASIVTAALIATVLLVTPAAAQQPQQEFSPLAEAIGSMLVTLVFGGGLVALAPEYTERTTDRILQRPGETLVYGLVLSVALIVVLFVLVVTRIGIILAIPLVIVVGVLSVLGFLAAGRVVASSLGVALLVAVLLSAFTGGVPLFGTLVGFVLSCMGIGAAYLDYRDDGPQKRRSRRAHRPTGRPR